MSWLSEWSDKTFWLKKRWAFNWTGYVNKSKSNRMGAQGNSIKEQSSSQFGNDSGKDKSKTDRQGGFSNGF